MNDEMNEKSSGQHLAGNDPHRLAWELLLLLLLSFKSSPSGLGATTATTIIIQINRYCLITYTFEDLMH